jgi:hypothetical protein
VPGVPPLPTVPPLEVAPPVPGVPPLPGVPPVSVVPPLPVVLPLSTGLVADENAEHEATSATNDSATDRGAAERTFFICDISRCRGPSIGTSGAVVARGDK